MPAPWQPPDLDEIGADLFVVNNEKVGPFLRGAGERDGKFFRMTDWRREGWLARLRMAGFNVRTLEDRVAVLKAIPPVEPRGEQLVRALATARERLAAWDADRLRWHDRPVETVGAEQVVRLCLHEPVRRRKSRSGGDFFVVVAERAGRAGLRPVSEPDAILHAYAQMVAEGHPAVLRAQVREGVLHLPAGAATLPERHRETLDLLAEQNQPRWTFDSARRPLVEAVFAKLGATLVEGYAGERDG